MNGRWLLLDLALVVGVFAYAERGMGYPWQLALLTALAVGAFSYSARRTWWNLRFLHRPPEERLDRTDPLASSASADDRSGDDEPG